MNKNAPEVLFTLQAALIPAVHRDWLKELGCRRSSRHTDEFPIWWRIDGIGYTLWLSEFGLADSTATPSTWQLKLETLAALPPAGIEQWDITVEAIEPFLQDEKIPFVTNDGQNHDT